MSKVEELVERAKRLKEKGLTTGEIADELNVSRETALWLLTKAKEGATPPSDIYIDWKRVSTVSRRLRLLAEIMADMILEAGEVEVVVGVATSGIPISTLVAELLDAELSIYFPKKLKWDEDATHISGAFSENYAKVDGKRCVIVDDVITSGSTIEETVEHIRRRDGSVLCAAVIVDKRGMDELSGIPILSLFRIVRI
jgi:orotate phosphoribosyltransferase